MLDIFSQNSTILERKYFFRKYNILEKKKFYYFSKMNGEYDFIGF
jgi:hypothetical protein